MANRFHIKENNFWQQFSDFLASRKNQQDVREPVRDLIAQIRARGDAALIEQIEKFDGVKLAPHQLKLPLDQIKETARQCPPKTLEALDYAARRIEAWHQKQLPKDIHFTDEEGVTIHQRWQALDSVGFYVPGGSARYPSSLLMSALPAKIAGVKRRIAVTPPQGTNDPLLMAAFLRADILDIWQIGGVGAIAALAYGTSSIGKVDKITGPGNAYVAEAKRQVFGDVGIDMVAGPSEILVIADGQHPPDWIAADLLSQAEHDESAQAILITNDEPWAEKVASAVETQLQQLPRKKIAQISWKRYGAIIIVTQWSDAIELANYIAAEHIELLVDPHGELSGEMAEKIRHVGSLFIGPWTPEVLGDYVIGTNHILPTSGSARFSSALSVYDFMKRSSITHCPQQSFDKLAEKAEVLASAEKLQAHARAATIRKRS